MGRPQITITCSVAWWVRPYLHLLAVVALLTGRMPDMERVRRTVAQGVWVRAKP